MREPINVSNLVFRMTDTDTETDFAYKSAGREDSGSSSAAQPRRDLLARDPVQVARGTLR